MFFFFPLPVGPVEKKKKFIVALETVFAGKGELMDWPQAYCKFEK